MSVDFDVRGQQEMEFFTGGSIIMGHGLAFWSDLFFPLFYLMQ